MPARRFLLSALSESAPALAAWSGLGLELVAFCTAQNMDPPDFDRWMALVRAQAAAAPAEVFHAPFAELFPCAIDPKARALAMERLSRAAEIARSLGISRMVAHSGYIPRVYFPQWFEEKSAAFWREFLAGQPGDFQLLVENVLDDDPACLRRMLSAVDDPRARACLDVGHALVASPHAPEAWARALGPLLGHVHLHDNHGRFDEHNPPGNGLLNLDALFAALDASAPAATVTLECPDAEGAIAWFTEYAPKHGLIKTP